MVNIKNYKRHFLHYWFSVRTIATERQQHTETETETDKLMAIGKIFADLPKKQHWDFKPEAMVY